MFTHNLINAVGHSMQVRVPCFSLFVPILLWLVAFVSIIYVTVYLKSFMFRKIQETQKRMKAKKPLN